MARQTKAQQETVGRVIHEYKHGSLRKKGQGTIRNPKQAIAIALREAGAANRQSPAENHHHLRHTRRAAADAGQTRAALYRRAAAAKIPGRSRMSKAQLQEALRH